MDSWWRKTRVFSMIISSETFLTTVFKTGHLNRLSASFPFPHSSYYLLPDKAMHLLLYFLLFASPSPDSGWRNLMLCVCLPLCLQHRLAPYRKKHLRSLTKDVHGWINVPHLILAMVISKICHLHSIPALAFQRENRELLTLLSFLTSLNSYVINDYVSTQAAIISHQ